MFASHMMLDAGSSVLSLRPDEHILRRIWQATLKLLCIPLGSNHRTAHIPRGSRHLLAAVMVVGSLLVPRGFAQTKQPSMDVGTVTLNLGTPRDKTLAQIKNAGYKFLELPPEGKETKVAVTQRDVDKDPVQRAMAVVDNDGVLFFRSGILVRIRREVAASAINTDRDLAFSLYAIVQGLEKEGGGDLCSVKTTEDTFLTDHPGLEAKTVTLNCSLGNGIFRTSYIRWTVAEKLRNQLHVVVFQDLWR